MKDYLIGGVDLQSIENGESVELSIPGSTEDVVTWLQKESRSYIALYNAPHIFSGQVLLAAKKDNQIAVVFTNFSRVTDLRCTFEMIYHQAYKHLAYEILSSVGGAFGAEWQIAVKKELAAIPPLDYYEWTKPQPGPMPGSTVSALVRHEGPPPEWKPPVERPGQPKAAQNVTTLRMPTLAIIEMANRWNRIYDLSKKGDLVIAIANDSKVNLSEKQVIRIRRELNISEPRKKPKAT